ncbi:MAG TPA: ABC transporter substrate-binding protein [Actinomycetota bacterium]|nr:ABC transporter substrate-binding protein [Actinomycetota bacterium]
MRTRAHRLVVLLAVATIVVAACSSPPTSDEDGDGGSNLTDVTEALNGVYAELEGLDPEARREKLIELADEEGGTFDAYGSTNLDDIFPMIDEFESQTGLEVNYYRASSTDVLERVLQEADADFPGADVVFTNGPELTVIDREGLLAPLNSPVTDDIDPQGVFETWAWLYLNTFVGSWNTSRTQSPPATWEDLLAYGDGLAVEVGDFDWFATLVKDYFMAEQGMSEDEAVDLFREAVNGAALVDGHTLMAELLAAGEYDVASSTYLHRILQLKKDDAPVEWEGGPAPIIIRPNGIGIHRYAEKPASALLFLEFMLTDAQQLLLDIDRQPASAGVSGGGIPEGAETMVVDLEALLDEREKWEGLWDEIVEGSEGQTYED